MGTPPQKSGYGERNRVGMENWQARMDRMQAETNARFDAMHAENSRQHDDLNRRFDEMFEVLRAFEGRISHLEGPLDKRATGDAGQ